MRMDKAQIKFKLYKAATTQKFSNQLQMHSIHTKQRNQKSSYKIQVSEKSKFTNEKRNQVRTRIL